jgi:hypothetical protein
MIIFDEIQASLGFPGVLLLPALEAYCWEFTELVGQRGTTHRLQPYIVREGYL